MTDRVPLHPPASSIKSAQTELVAFDWKQKTIYDVEHIDRQVMDIWNAKIQKVYLGSVGTRVGGMQAYCIKYQKISSYYTTQSRFNNVNTQIHTHIICQMTSE